MTATTAPPPNPRFRTEDEAAREGWTLITSWLYLPEEADTASRIMATFDGTAPGSRAVTFCIVGDASRIAFARRTEELRLI